MLLIKFEQKTARVKGISFHPTRPWILTSLHTGFIQLWDYSIPILLNKFDNHEGPVRAIDFHCRQPLFVSGGDDHKIKVWNLKQRKCLFTLVGHLDYIRTTYFHHEYPWIVSASDDQTMRIWNWQSRNCIAVLPGHNYYVMSARFHPTEDLIISSSLDLTVRIWDFSGLRKKNVYSAHNPIQSQVNAKTGAPELFGQADTIVKFVLEGHERGINWATFHPAMPLAASGGDDRQIKLWRINDNRAWELDTLRGHINNVTCVIFHPRRDLLISTSEDKSMRIWDIAKKICIETFQMSQSSRFWIVSVHPKLNLFAAGHDNGFILFKLERERPAFCIMPNGDVLYAKADKLRLLETNTKKDVEYQALRNIDGFRITDIYFNPVEKLLLVMYRSLHKKDEGYYQLCRITGSDQVPASREPLSRNACLDAVWLSSNKIAVLQSKGKILVRNTHNEDIGSITGFSQCEKIFGASENYLIIKNHNEMYLYDFVEQKSVSNLHLRGVKRVILSSSRKLAAIIHKSGVCIVTHGLEEITSITEKSSIKSGLFERNDGVFVYTTLTHIRYVLLSGNRGVLCTLSTPLYLVKSLSDRLFVCLTRDGVPQLLTVDTTEYQFKLALENKRYEQVVQIVRDCDIIGQNTIAYLYNQGYPEIALRFVDNKQTRYGLAIECGELQEALCVARELEEPNLWTKLAQVAVHQGNVSIAEIAWQKLRQLDKLAMLYLFTGNMVKLLKILKIVETRSDESAKYRLSLLTGDVESEISALERSGQYYLAYLAAKTNHLEDRANGFCDRFEFGSHAQNGGSSQSERFEPLKPLKPFDSDFPLLQSNQSFLYSISSAAAGRAGNTMFVSYSTTDKYANQFDLIDTEQSAFDNSLFSNGQRSGWAEDLMGSDDALLPSTTSSGARERLFDVRDTTDGIDVSDDGDDSASGAAGWDVDGVSSAMIEETLMREFEPVTPGQDLILAEVGRGEPSPLGLIQSGNFKAVMQQLQSQYGIADFSFYTDIFLKFYVQHRMCLKGVSGHTDPLLCYPVQIGPHHALKEGSNGDEGEANVEPTRRLSDVVSFEILTDQLQTAYSLTTKAKFVQSIKTLKEIVLTLPLLNVKRDKQMNMQVTRLRRVCQQYILGQQIELERRDLSKTNPADTKRNCELAIYFAHCELRPQHKILAWKTALNICFKSKNYKSAILCGNNIMHLGPLDELSISTGKIIRSAEASGATNHDDIDYDELNPFDVCASSYSPIYRGSPLVKCPLCLSCYKPEFAGQLCRLTCGAEIGFEGSLDSK